MDGPAWFTGCEGAGADPNNSSRNPLGSVWATFSILYSCCIPEPLTEQGFPEATIFPCTKLKQAYQPELDLKVGDLSKKV